MTLTPDTLKGIFFPLHIPPSYWNSKLPKASLFDLVAQVSGGSADSVIVVPTGNLSSSNVQDALEELQSDIDALSAGTIPTYTKTFTNVTTDTINSGEHGLSAIHNVLIKTSSDQIVDVVITITGTTVVIDSNVSLLNHKLLIY